MIAKWCALGLVAAVSVMPIVACGGDDNGNNNGGGDGGVADSGGGDSAAPKSDSSIGDSAAHAETSVGADASNAGDAADASDGADAGPCDFAAFVTNLVKNDTTSSALPSTDLGQSCVDQQDQAQFQPLFQ